MQQQAPRDTSALVVNLAIEGTPVQGQKRLSLKTRMLSASMWAVMGSVGANVIRLLSNLVLTRLLFPEAFGLMMIATTVLVIMGMLSDMGVQQSIVRGERGEDPAFLDTAWVVQIVRGTVMWLGACLVALALHFAVSFGLIPAQSTYADPLLPWIVATSAFTAVITGFQATDIALANRRLNLKRMVMLELASQVLGIFLMVVLAWQLKSVWALVISGLASTLFYALASHHVFRIHRNRARVDRQALHQLLSFGKWLALSSAVSVFVSNGDRLILGALVGPQVLGLFSIAITLAGALDQMLQSLFARVMLPVFSEVARDQPSRIVEALFRLRWRIDPVMLSAGGMLFALGPTIVATLYDGRYQAAGEMLQILSLGLIVGRFSILQQVYIVLDKPRYLVLLNLIRFVSVYVGIPIGYYMLGLNGALLAIALKDLAAVPAVLWMNSRHNLNNFWLELVWLLFWPIGFSIGWIILQACTFAFTKT